MLYSISKPLDIKCPVCQQKGVFLWRWREKDSTGGGLVLRCDVCKTLGHDEFFERNTVKRSHASEQLAEEFAISVWESAPTSKLVLRYGPLSEKEERSGQKFLHKIWGHDPKKPYENWPLTLTIYFREKLPPQISLITNEESHIATTDDGIQCVTYRMPDMDQFGQQLETMTYFPFSSIQAIVS